MTARLLMRGQSGFLEEQGFEVIVVASPGEDLDIVRRTEGVRVVGIPMRREIEPLHDLKSLAYLVLLLRQIRPHLVNAGTPKAGLLGMVAARLAGVPVCVYTLRGLRLETTTGLKRTVLRAGERVAAACAHRIVCVSESLRRRYVELGLAPEVKTCVLGAGSSNGVDVHRFGALKRGGREWEELRTRLGIPEGVPVVGFVGRFTRDKGIEELLAAFDVLSLSLPEVRLLLVGDFEEGDPVPQVVEKCIREHQRIVLPGFVKDTAPYYSLMDVLAFPSYREGFPNAPLEAAASGVPVVGFRVTGTVDAVEDGVTGTLVSPGDQQTLAEVLLRYLEDPSLRLRHGQAGRLRVEKFFGRETVWRRCADEYRKLLGSF